MFSVDLMLSGNVFHRVGAVTEKVGVPAFVLTLGTASIYDLDVQGCLCRLAGLSVASKYEGYVN